MIEFRPDQLDLVETSRCGLLVKHNVDKLRLSAIDVRSKQVLHLGGRTRLRSESLAEQPSWGHRPRVLSSVLADGRGIAPGSAAVGAVSTFSRI